MKPWAAFAAGAGFAAIVAVFVLHREPGHPPAEQPAAPAAQVQEAQTATPAPVAPAETPVPVAAPPAPRSAPAPVREPRRTSISQPPVATAARPAPAKEPAPVVQPAPAPVSVAETPTPAPKPAPAPPPPPNQVTLRGGTILTVRLLDPLSSESATQGQTFQATLDQPLVVDGFVVAERGAKVDGRVVESTQAGRVRGVAQLSLELTGFSTSDGQRIGIATDSFVKNGEEDRRGDAAKVAAGAGVGAALGAIFGGGKGAAIGAASGGAAGGGVVMATRGKPAALPAETRLNFRLSAPVTITEKLLSPRNN